MPGYAVGHLWDVEVGPDIVEYLERIDATLAPFEGRFLVHGAEPDVREGDWRGHLIVIEFPDLERARAWYESDAYRPLIPLRANNSQGEILLVDGASPDHKATDVLAAAH